MAAPAVLREQLPDLVVRVVNVVDLMRLQPHTEHPHGMADAPVRTLVIPAREDVEAARQVRSLPR